MKKILSFDELNDLAIKLVDKLEENDVIALIGDLGTGKTTFVKVIADKLGIKENLKSPTFNYVLSYESGKIPLHHFDVYRICDPEEVYEIGFEDYLNSDGISIIEWANLIDTELPKEYIEINLEHNDEASRRVEVLVHGNKKREEEILAYVGFSN